MVVNQWLQPYYYYPGKDEEKEWEDRERHLEVSPAMKKSKASPDTNSKLTVTALPTGLVTW